MNPLSISILLMKMNRFEGFLLINLNNFYLISRYILKIFEKFMPFIAIAIRNSNLYTQSRKEAQTNKVLLELATIVFDESSTTVDNLVSRILFNSIYLLECERCQVLLLKNNSANNSLNDLLAATSSHRPPSLNSVKHMCIGLNFFIYLILNSCLEHK
jgi:hypothetical protein